jgi:N-acetylglutamate synthase-like GNAT family acetyltransferase
MVDHVIDVAKEAKLKALFACSSNQRAVEFFERCGFEQVDPDRAPSAKWVGRRGDTMPVVLWRDL